ncbi:MAG: (d)CMP kinase [Sedimentisphaerales bacterium]|jgi:cytidylate kinase
MVRLVITIDGPAASGKSTVARLLAAKLDAVFLDTGAMYRAATLAAMLDGADLTNQQRILEVLDETVFEFKATPNGMLVRIDGVDATAQIRDPKVTANARYVACLAPARQRLVDMQRRFAQAYERIVSEGRDQGTVVFPDANAKFYLTADLNERARRRQVELKAKGIMQTDDEICQAILKRDQSDENRSVGPLKPADDAVIVDTTDLSIDEVVEKLVDFVKQKCPMKL